jgi:ABC-type transport system involved in multi-copper enzyme maturation permease subunit
MTRAKLPTTTGALVAIVRLTLTRALRGRALWLAAAFAALPLLYAATAQGRHRYEDELLQIELLVMCVVQPLLVAASIGEEIEDRTTTYLWSRPLPRWTVLVGKLVAVAPIGALLVVASLTACALVEYGRPLALDRSIAFFAGALATGAASAGVATLVPKHGMALAITVLGASFVIGNIPWSLQIASVTRQTIVLAVQPGATPAIALASIAAVWLALGLARVRRLEA